MKKRLYVFLGVLILAATSPASCANPRYTRTECIAKAKLYWPNEMSAEDRERIIDEIFSAEKKMRRSGYKAPVAGFGIRNDDRSDFYIQYRDSCKSKKEMTRDFFERVAREIKRLPRYEVTDEVVVPSPKTIDIRGPSWVDGMPLHTPGK